MTDVLATVHKGERIVPQSLSLPLDGQPILELDEHAAWPMPSGGPITIKEEQQKFRALVEAMDGIASSGRRFYQALKGER